MAPKFKKADSFDEFTTEKLDVVQNRLLGDYNALGIYSINKKVSAELVELKKVKKESYNNEFFCTAQTHGGRFIDFEISFKKNSESKLLVAELYVLEGVPKQGGRMMNVLKTPIGKYTSQVTPDFVDIALKKFNVVYAADDEGQDRKDIDDEYITKRGMLLAAIDKLTADSYNVIYEDYFTQRINLLKATNNSYTKKILAIFNDEFNKISDFFLLDKKTKKVLNYKAMNELLDKAFDDLYGLDEYAESEKDFKQRLLPILTMFISGAERIDASAKKSVLDNVPKKFKDDMTEALLDVKQAQESRQAPQVKESNTEMVAKDNGNKLKDLTNRLSGKGKSTTKEDVSTNSNGNDEEFSKLMSDLTINPQKLESLGKNNSTKEQLKNSDDKTQANIDYDLENIKDDAKNETVTVEVVSGEKNETSVIPEGNLNKGDFGKRKVENVKEDLNNMFGNGLTLNDSVSHK